MNKHRSSAQYMFHFKEAKEKGRDSYKSYKGIEVKLHNQAKIPRILIGDDSKLPNFVWRHNFNADLSTGVWVGGRAPGVPWPGACTT